LTESVGLLQASGTCACNQWVVGKSSFIKSMAGCLDVFDSLLTIKMDRLAGAAMYDNTGDSSLC